MARPRNNLKGFTLIELILVMFVLAIIAGFAAPNLRGFMQGRRGSDTATQILGMARWARSMAISDGTIYQLNVDENAQSVWVTKLDDTGASQQMQNDMGTPLTLPTNRGGLHVSADFPTGDGGVKSVRFYPTGRCETGTIEVSDPNSGTYQITCESPAEQYHLVNQGGK